MSDINTLIRNRYAIKRYAMTGVKLDEARLENEGIAVFGAISTQDAST